MTCSTEPAKWELQETPGKVTGRSAFSGAAEDESFHTREGLPGWWTCDGVCVLASEVGETLSAGGLRTPHTLTEQPGLGRVSSGFQMGVWGARPPQQDGRGRLWGESVRGLWTWLGGFLVAAGYRLLLLQPRLRVSALPTSFLLSPSRRSISSSSLVSSLPL